MFQSKNKSLFIAKLLLGFLLIYIPQSWAQEGEHESEYHEFSTWRIGFGFGQTYLPAGQHESEEVSMLVLPTVGLDIHYWFNPRFGLALKNELEIQYYVIENEYYNELEREYPFIIVLVAMYKLKNGPSFYLGPGVELEKNKNFFILKGGIEYELEFERNWDVTPEIYYFSKEGKVGGFGAAVTFGKRF